MKGTNVYILMILIVIIIVSSVLIVIKIQGSNEFNNTNYPLHDDSMKIGNHTFYFIGLRFINQTILVLTISGGPKYHNISIKDTYVTLGLPNKSIDYHYSPSTISQESFTVRHTNKNEFQRDWNPNILYYLEVVDVYLEVGEIPNGTNVTLFLKYGNNENSANFIFPERYNGIQYMNIQRNLS